MWKVQPGPEYEKRAKRCPKKYLREFVAVHDNLDTFLLALNRAATPEQAHFGFIHPEPRGVLAIDQKGGGAGLKQTRLYTYPHRASQILYLITIGDKSSQTEDVRFASEFVEQLAQEEQRSDG